MTITRAWFISSETEELFEANFKLPALTSEEVLVEPIYGCWEANMSHAIQKWPIDICKKRNESRVIVGNGGIVRILKGGKDVKNLKEGDLCMLYSNGQMDQYGYPVKILGYDMPGSLGLLSKRSKFHYKNLIKLSENSKYTLQQWAAFSVRYTSAWANWRVAYNTFRVQVTLEKCQRPFIFAWGGGVSFAQCLLAQYFDCDTSMVVSGIDRINMLKKYGISPIDRAQYENFFSQNEEAGKEIYESEKNKFLQNINELSQNKEISILLDHIGGKTFPVSLRILGRQSVIATTGWKDGMKYTILRAVECINRRIHVHTHYASYDEVIDSINFSEKNGWIPPVDEYSYQWEEIPSLADLYNRGKLSTYFPIYEVNKI